MYLEFFIAGLTGFFFWLLLHHVRAFKRDRMRQQAGPLLVIAKSTRFFTAISYTAISVLFILFWGLCAMHIRVTLRSSSEFIPSIVTDFLPIYFIDFDCFLVTFSFFAYLSFLCRRRHPFEIREQGIVLSLLPGLIRWEEIRYCQRPSLKGNCLKIYVYRSVRPIFSVSGPELTTILGRFVEVRDTAGNVIAAPPEGHVLDQSGKSRKKGISRFLCLQYDLLTLFLLMLFVASASSWYGYHFMRSKPQRDAIAKLEEFQPWVDYYDTDVQVLIFDSEKRLPSDADLVAIKSLPQIKIISLRGQTITDAGLMHLESASQLKRLGLVNTAVTGSGLEFLENSVQLRSITLYGSPISDANLNHLAAFPLLESVNLRKTTISDAGLKHLAPLTQLKELELEGTNITDAGLASLKPLVKLEYLDLSGTKISGNGLINLGSLKKLKTLELGNTQVSDAVLKHLAPLTQLTSLGLEGTKTTDAGLASFKPFAKLEYLVLNGTKISDNGLPSLYGLKNLKSLELGNTQVSRAGIAALAKALPNTTIAGISGTSSQQTSATSPESPDQKSDETQAQEK